MNAYLIAKNLHVGCVILSLGGFAARGMLMLGASPLLERRFVRIAPHVVDTVLLASALWRRLTHRPAVWSTATIERLAAPHSARVPAGTFSTIVYVVRTGDGREGRFHVERAYPHRIVKWDWQPARGAKIAMDGLDAGELAGTERVEYWKLHGNGDERWLEKLGIAPTVAPRVP